MFLGIPSGPLWGEAIVQGRDWIVGEGGNLLGYWWTWIPATVALIVVGVAGGYLAIASATHWNVVAGG